jgi:hypothetical protein
LVYLLLFSKISQYDKWNILIYNYHKNEYTILINDVSLLKNTTNKLIRKYPSTKFSVKFWNQEKLISI